MLDRDYTEKRDFIRMKVNTPAKVNIEQAGVIVNGICNDLSGSGMLLTLSQQLPLDSELIVTLNAELGSAPTLQAKCVVARLQPAANKQYLLGLEILEVLNTEEVSTEEA